MRVHWPLGKVPGKRHRPFSVQALRSAVVGAAQVGHAVAVRTVGGHRINKINKNKKNKKSPPSLGIRRVYGLWV